jgi:hypothetical protein
MLQWDSGPCGLPLGRRVLRQQMQTRTMLAESQRSNSPRARARYSRRPADSDPPLQRMQQRSRSCGKGERWNCPESGWCCVGVTSTSGFGKKDTILIPPGAPALSDPVDLPVTDGSEIAISLYFPKRVTSVTGHSLALRSAVISKHGDQTQDIAARHSSRKTDVVDSLEHHNLDQDQQSVRRSDRL